MDDLVFQFLLQAGYPRASIIADATLLVASGGGGTVSEEATTYVVVDPETAERLAAIDVVEAVDGETLQIIAGRVGRYACQLGGRDVQGFIIRVDPRGRNDAEQVQFYRVWPNPIMQRLSAKTFPDLESLKVARRLSTTDTTQQRSEIVDAYDEEEEEFVDPDRPVAGAARWVPAILLLLLVITDWYLVQTRGVALLSVAQSLLAVGAAALLTLAILTGRR